MKQSQKQQPKSDAKLVALIAGALAMKKSAQATAEVLSPNLGIPVPTLLIILAIAQSRAIAYGNVFSIDAGSATGEASSLEPTYRAAYVLAASRRLRGLSGEALDKAVQGEKRYFNQHMKAVAKRRAAANAVDKARIRYGDDLGWYAKLDSKTSPECRQANGKNFSASRMPAIGYPGAVHPDCRCKPGKKHATSQTVYGIKLVNAA